MKRRALTSSILIVHALAAATSSCSSDGDNVGGVTNNENVAEAELAVSNGTFDATDEYPFVGGLFWRGEAQPSCSAILITPGWILTADHCIFGAQAGNACGLVEGTLRETSSTDTWHVHFFNDPSTGTTPLPLRFEHTFAQSGFVHTILERAVDSCSNEDSALDLALIRLDKRVPLSLVTPKHPINGHCSPQPQINGTIIGYGPTSNIFSGGSDDPQRNYTTSDGWTLTSLTTGNVYINSYLIPPGQGHIPGLEYWYDGPLKGDSGGALIDADTGNLCGVTSRFYPAGVNPFAFASDIDDGEWDRSSGQISMSFS